MNRRDFLTLAAVGGGAVFASALPGMARAAGKDFYFVQLSDSHWGYQGPANPDARITLPKAVAAVNALEQPPAFIVFTGDLTHTTDDPAERRRRMSEFKSITAELKVRDIHYLAGEHDASLDHGEAFHELFGPSWYAFDHQGVHFVAIDNVSDPGARVDDAQLDWLRADLAKLAAGTSVVVLTHRPLFDLAPNWGWATRNGQAVVDILLPYPNVTVFYGHIHQELHHQTGHITHHSARSLIFPLPAPGSQDKRTPLPWDPAMPYRGLGFRGIAKADADSWQIHEYPVVRT
ncbi:MAG: metallophosphoesterase [Pseudomonadota bacterium]|nr:metallophosphoesterase [Pseudomonadota bacterium]